VAFMAPRQHKPDERGGGAEERKANGERSRNAVERASEHVGPDAKNSCPHYPSRRVEEQKPRPRHLIDSREQRRKGAQQRHEATEEHHLSAVPEEQKLPDLEPRFGRADAGAVPQQERESDPTADQVSERIADDGAARRRGDHELDAQL